MIFRLNACIAPLAKSLFLFMIFSANANEAKLIEKQDRNYISGGLVLNEFRSVDVIYEESIDPELGPGQRLGNTFPVTGQTYALSFTYGTYITENFKTEIRYGSGIREDTLDELLDVNINYSFNWYIGGTLPVTEYLNAYAMLGVSFYDADVKQREIKRTIPGPDGFTQQEELIRPSTTEMNEDLFGTKFSMSWMLGMDYKLSDRWYLAFEYGRLLKDTDTNIKVYQAGTHLRYEY